MKKILLIGAVVLSSAAAFAEAPSPRAAFAAHSHMCRKRNVPFETSISNLVRWVRRHDVKAFGIGSPWTPLQASRMIRCERQDRHRYYAGELKDEDFVDKADLCAMLASVSNECSGTTFFLDNETPKNRYGHIWYLGYSPIVSGWHDYSQDRRTAFTDDELEDPSCDINPLTGKAHIRRSYGEVVAEQRKAGALAIWAHPTSWWTKDGDPKGPFVTNIAADMPVQLFADGGLDGLTVMGYDAYHRDYQNLWFAILDMGYRVPGLAEQDSSPAHGIIGKKDERLLNYILSCDHAPSVDEIKSAVKSFNVVMSSGPDLRLMKLEEKDGKIAVTVYAAPAAGESELALVEILGRGGEVRAVKTNVKEGTYKFEFPDRESDSWFVARAFGEGVADPHSVPQQTIKISAITNPMWLDRASVPPKPVKTRLVIADPRSTNARWRIETAAGAVVRSFRGAATLEVSPLDILIISYDDGRTRRLPLYMANARVRELMDYIAEGRFRFDSNRTLYPGEVPVRSFRFDEFKKVLRNQTISL